MNWLYQLLGKAVAAPEKAEPFGPLTPFASAPAAPVSTEAVRFGRYSDNNKSVTQMKAWYRAEDLFKQRHYRAALEAFFQYLTDEVENNVAVSKTDSSFQFTLYQGNVRIDGRIDGQRIVAMTTMATMPNPSPAVMRRVLELNSNLYYSHTALDAEQRLCMLFQSEIATANPSKLYFGLRELAVIADKQDDLLVADFSDLRRFPHEHISKLTPEELRVKFQFFTKWINQALADVAALNADAFAGTVAYLLLAALYRIDFLILPHGALLLQMEKIHGLYWEQKNERTLVARNKGIADALRKLGDYPLEVFEKSIYRSPHTFSIASPQPSEKYRDNILVSVKDSRWYIENNFANIACQILEYGLLFSQFGASVPKVQTDLTILFEAVLYPSFFKALGFDPVFYDEAEARLNPAAIRAAIDQILVPFLPKYPHLRWAHDQVSYDNRYAFCASFAMQVANLNLALAHP